MKRAFVAIGVVVLLIAGAVLGAPHFVDWQRFKPEIEQLAARTFDGEVTISGSLGVRFLPAPALVADDFSLVTRLRESGLIATARAGRVRVDLGLASLLGGRVEVERLGLEAVELVLEPETADPVVVDSPDIAASATDPGTIMTDAAPTTVIVADATAISKEIQITDGRLVLRLPELSGEEVLEAVSGDVTLGAGDGPSNLAGGFTWRGIPVRARLETGRALEERRGASLVLAVGEGAADVMIDGTLSGRALSTLTLDGKIRVVGTDTAAIADTLTGAATLPVQLRDRPFRARGTIAASLGRMVVDLSEVTVDQTRGTAKVIHQPGGAADWRVETRLQRLDLDAWRAVPVGDTDAEGPRSDWLTGMDLAVRLEVASLIHKAQPIRDVTAETIIRDGSLQILNAGARLPGTTDLVLFGEVPITDFSRPLDIGWEAKSENFRSLASWIGADLSLVRPGRLGRMSVTGRASGTWPRLTLNDILLQLDDSRIDGAVVAVLGDRPAFGVGLRIDEVNLDRYLPGPFLLSLQDGGEPTLREADLSDYLDGIDANVRLELGRMEYAGLSLAGLALDATLFQGTTTLKSLSVADLAGAKLSMAGEIRRDGGVTDALEAAMDLESENFTAVLDRLLPFVPADWRGLVPTDSLPGRISVQAKGTPDRLDGQFDLTLDKASITAAGFLDQPFSGRRAGDVALALAHGDTGAVVTWLTGHHRGLRGAMSASARLVGSGTAWRMEEMTGLAADTELSGDLALDWSGPQPGITGTLGFSTVETGDGIEPSRETSPARWPTRELPLGWLTSVRMDVALTADRFGAVDRASARLVGGDGLYRLEAAEADWAGGRLTAEADIKAVPAGAELSAKITLTEARLERALDSKDGLFKPQGRLGGDLDVTTRGRSPSQWISRLAGTGHLQADDVTGNPSGVDGLPGKLAGRVGAGPLVERLRADLDIANGVVSTRNVEMDSDYGEGRLVMQADLPAWRLDGRIGLDASQGTSLPPLQVRLSGPLDAPNSKITLDGIPSGLLESLSR